MIEGRADIDRYFPRPVHEQAITRCALDFDESGGFRLPWQVITGISGVGKTWLITEIADKLNELENMHVGLAVRSVMNKQKESGLSK